MAERRACPVASNALKILAVSWYMPPYNTMGALRVGKFVDYLDGRGHDVRVLCARGLPFDQTLPLDFPEDRIRRAAYWDINAPLKKVQSVRAWLHRRVRPRPTPGSDAPVDAVPSTAAVPAGAGDAGLLRRMREVYQRLTNFPDPQVGWLLPGLAGGRLLLRDWRPDLIFASAPPFTTLMIGKRLSREFGIPWVAEYRDRLYEDPYGNEGPARKARQKRFEDRLLDGVSGIVTVSEPWAEDYRARLGLPVVTVYNGFDPRQFPVEVPREPGDPDLLRIVYTGILYPERRDPSPLFAAIALLGEQAKSVRVAFYGANEAVVRAMARRHGVLDRVETHGRVPYEDSIALQMQADVLLLLQWNDPRERGNVPGKVFEYLGSRRPVLGIGIEDGVPAHILGERNAGVVLNDPRAIARQLRSWLDQKRAEGAIPLLPESVRDGLSRPEQYRGLEDFLVRIAGRGSGE